MTIAITLWLALQLATAPTSDAGDAAQQFAEIAALVERGRLDDARGRLASATLPDGARHRLAGWIALRSGEPATAIRELERALELGPDDPTLRLYLASARLDHGDPAGAIAALEGTEALAETTIAQPLVRARALAATGALTEAYAALEAATRRFADDPSPRIELMVLCATEGLESAARAWAESVVAIAGARLDRSTALAIFAATSRDAAALPLLESLARRWPDDPEIAARLAHAWSADGRWYAAARVFEHATRRGGDYAFEAADQYRLAGFFARALALNARVTEDRRRLSQRIDILFAAGKPARVVALAAAAAAAGVTEPASRMRIAHAHWQLGQHLKATEVARALVGTSEDSAARALLRAMGRTDSDARTNEPSERIEAIDPSE